MKKAVLFPCILLAAILAACVTINVYFPEAAAEKAADRIIGNVIGKSTESTPAGKPETGTEQGPTGADLRPGDSASAAHGMRLLALGLDRVLTLAIPTAEAAAPDLDVSSAAIRQITDSMKARHERLVKYYDSGAIGYTADGLVAIRDANLIPLAERNSVRNAVADENRDRTSLYTEIARANGHPEWAADIRATFAKRWVANAKSGWYYNDGSGWKRK